MAARRYHSVFQEGYYITTAWAPGRSGAQTLNNIVTMFSKKTVEQGMAALGSIETSWNWVLADRDGSIGFQMSGLMPKRREGVSGFVPLPGWEEKNDWQGFHKAEDLPRCLNPECGYFVTSNQDLNAYGNVDPINIGMGPYRSDRISDLLSENTSWFGYRTRTEIYREAAEKALATAPEKWGNVRRVIMKNILFDGKLPRFLGFDRGPITIIGSLATPHQGQIFESANRLTTFAPSLRMVTDLAEDDLYTNLAGGPSDRRFSKWYASDLDNWAAGRYKQVRVDAEKAYDF